MGLAGGPAGPPLRCGPRRTLLQGTAYDAFSVCWCAHVGTASALLYGHANDEFGNSEGDDRTVGADIGVRIADCAAATADGDYDIYDDAAAAIYAAAAAVYAATICDSTATSDPTAVDYAIDFRRNVGSPTATTDFEFYLRGFAWLGDRHRHRDAVRRVRPGIPSGASSAINSAADGSYGAATSADAGDPDVRADHRPFRNHGTDKLRNYGTSVHQRRAGAPNSGLARWSCRATTTSAATAADHGNDSVGVRPIR